MKKTVLCTFILIVMLMTACTSKPIEDDEAGQAKMAEGLELEQVNRPRDGDEIAIITTNIGEIRMVLFSDIAPNAVNEFKRLVEEGYYDYLIFDRIVEDFLIQVQRSPLYPYDKSVSGENYEDEINSEYCHITGAVGMAKHHDKNSEVQFADNSSFYIIYQNGLDPSEIDALKEDGKSYSEATLKAYEKLGGIPRLDGLYTIFAQVYLGIELVREINQIPIDSSTGVPSEYITIMSIEIKTYEEK
ncbi:peptidylprolyl isomerase [Fusibacter bizertensis]